MLRHRLSAVAFGGLLCTVACSSGTGPGSDAFAGTWKGGGALAGDVFTVAQGSGDQVTGGVSGPGAGDLAGTDASGVVTFEVDPSVDGTSGTFYGSPYGFQGQFVNSSTINGMVGSAAATLTRQ